MEPNDDTLFWARVRLTLLLLEIARAMRDEGKLMLAAAKRLDPGR